MVYLDLVKQRGNFAFVEEHDEALYSALLEAERKIRLSRADAARNLRGALELFYGKATKNGKDESLIEIFRDSKLAENNRGYSYKDKVLDKNTDLFGMMGLYHYSRQAYCETADDMDAVRITTNEFTHAKRTTKLISHEECVELFRRTFKMLRIHYIDRKERPYYRFFDAYIPIGSYFVYEVISSHEHDCVLKCHAHKKDELSGKSMKYALIKIYKDTESSNTYLKDIEVLQHLWNKSDSHRYFARFSDDSVIENAGAEKYHIVRYELDQIPIVLSKEFIDIISIAHRKTIALDVFSAVHIIHNLSEPIYHRHICPENILISAHGSGYRPYMVNFEYTKLENSFTETVVSYVQNIAQKHCTVQQPIHCTRVA